MATVQLSKTLAALAEYWGSLPSIHLASNSHLRLQFQGIQHALLTSTGPGMHGVHTHTQVKHTYKKKK